MTLTLDPELAAALGALGAGGAPPENAVGLREGVAALYPVLTSGLARPDLEEWTTSIASVDAALVELHWFGPKGLDAVGPAVLHAHGGGMVAGSVALFAPYIREYVARSGVPFLSVEYRLAPEARREVPGQDVFAGLQWLHEHAAELGVDPARISVMGESAGGGLVAGATIRARAAGLAVARQLLIYPMLDDRTVEPDLAAAPFMTWTADANRIAWEALLGEERGSDTVPETVAPARLRDGTGLPPAYIEVGELDLFRDEDIRYAATLWAGGVDVELHVLPSLAHGWDQFAPVSSIRADLMDRRVRILRML